ncbi:hypothetical protein D5086_009452 [Populus alba]|uniref:Uncharacterized protein n=1 Tax=Populus alba TaxID=43335 RepID=A0ACC4CII4_POPAL
MIGCLVAAEVENILMRQRSTNDYVFCPNANHSSAMLNTCISVFGQRGNMKFEPPFPFSSVAALSSDFGIVAVDNDSAELQPALSNRTSLRPLGPSEFEISVKLF